VAIFSLSGTSDPSNRLAGSRNLPSNHIPADIFTLAGFSFSKRGISPNTPYKSSFSYPSFSSGVTVDASGTVYVSDTRKHRIQKFTLGMAASVHLAANTVAVFLLVARIISLVKIKRRR